MVSAIPTVQGTEWSSESASAQHASAGTSDRFYHRQFYTYSMAISGTDLLEVPTIYKAYTVKRQTHA